MSTYKNSVITKSYKKSVQLTRRMTAGGRMLPSFIIVGVARCGTTSLYSYLTQHPNVGSSTVKEVCFFDYNYHLGFNWYKKHFPLSLHKAYKRLIVGEASPSYMHHPLVPERIKAMNPNINLIILLRNPVDRAYSHYYQIVKTGRETLPFDIAARLQIAERDFFIKEKVLGNEKYFRRVYYPDAYLSKSVYIENLPRWFNIFSREQILLLNTEDMESNPQSLFKKTLEFLELPSWEPKEYKRYNYQGQHFFSLGTPTVEEAKQKKYQEIEVSIREQLVEYFRPYNEQLYDYLKTSFDWK